MNRAATRAFRIDVFDAPALSAFAANLDADTLKKAEAFLATDTGKRMVAADLALASLSDTDADKVMNGDIAAPSTPQRDALIEKLERAERSAESTVQILVTMGTAVAAGTAVGSGLDPGPVEQRARKSGEASRQTMEENMREPIAALLAYGYRDLSDADLKHVLAFLQSTAGKQYISAYLRLLGRRLLRHGQALRRAARRELARIGAGAALHRRRRARAAGSGQAPSLTSRAARAKIAGGVQSAVRKLRSRVQIVPI